VPPPDSAILQKYPVVILNQRTARITTSEDMIRRKAYELWEARGRPLGSSDADWYAAQLLLESAEPVDEAPPAKGPSRYGLRELESD